MTGFLFKATRMLHVNGQCYAAGETFRVSGADAGRVLESGRGEVAHPGDAEAIRQAIEADTAKTMRLVHGGRVLFGGPDDPWQRRL